MKCINSLKNNREFKSVYNKRISFANKLLIMYISRTEDMRLGISVSKKVGNSVVRHRLARLVRESYRLNKKHINNNYSIVVVVRPNAKNATFFEIESALIHLYKLQKIYI